MADNRRRMATSSLGLYGVPFYFNGVDQLFFVSQFRDRLSPNNPNLFNLQVPTTTLEGGTDRDAANALEVGPDPVIRQKVAKR